MFGDVINLANGKLELDPNGDFQLVEINENCIKYCLEESIEGHNISAFWSIYKIRHRDEQRSYRYEWKITVRRLRNNRVDGKRSTEHGSNVRSFLMRDQDYPNFFETVVQKKQPRMEKRIFSTLYDQSEHPFNLDYRSYSPYDTNQYDRGVENLNIGEYYAKGSAPTVRYQVRDGQLSPENNHVHHHFFLNKDEVPLLKSSHFEKVSAFPAQYNALAFQNGAIQPSQVSLPRVHNQLDSYGEVLPTTSQTPFHFPDELKLQDPIHPTTYRGRYDDNRESILDGEIKGNNFNHHHLHHHHHQNQIVSFPTRHTSVIPLSGITTTPTSFALNLNTSPPPSIQSFYPSQFANTKPLQSPNHQNPFFWHGRHSNNHQFNGQHLNFVGSIPYHENTFSELDPIYHGPTDLSTPSHITPSHSSEFDAEIHNPDAGYVSQLPLQDVSDGSSYDEPTEIHQTTSTNTDQSFTTPYNSVTPTKAANVQDEDDQNSYPDSINAQLPPPDSGADIRVPYVETDKSTSNDQFNRKTNTNFKTKIDIDDASVEQDNFEKAAEKTTKKSLRYKNQKAFSSTERSSWVPKRPRLRSSDKYKTNSELVKNAEKKLGYANRRKIVLRKTTTTTAEPTTVTQESSSEHDPITTTLAPELDLKLDEQPRTTQSVSKSVSVHIAEKVTVIPKKETKIVHSSKHGETIQKPRRVAKIKKVEKNVENSTEGYLEQ